MGVDTNRVALLAAVLERKEDMQLTGCDIFVNVAGGMQLTEPDSDLAVCAALVSSLKNKALHPQTLVLGEVGLAGEVRAVGQIELRLAEAEKFGLVPVLEPEKVTAIHRWAVRGHGIKAIARRLDVAPNTVRRYLRRPVQAGVQARPSARRLTERWRKRAREAFRTSAEYNAVRVHGLLAGQGIKATVWTIRRAVADLRTPQPAAPSVAEPAVPARWQEQFQVWELKLAKEIAQSKSTPDKDELEATLADWLNEVERVQLMLRLTPRLRQKHQD